MLSKIHTVTMDDFRNATIMFFILNPADTFKSKGNVFQLCPFQLSFSKEDAKKVGIKIPDYTYHPVFDNLGKGFVAEDELTMKFDNEFYESLDFTSTY